MGKTLILIPSRMSAKRLPGKPLLEIDGTTMISRVYKKALETKIGEAFVATEDQEIFDEVVKKGGKSVLTSKNHNTGTDRIFEAYEKIKPSEVDYILNIQGDEPMLNNSDIINLNNQIIKSNCDMGTLACKINEDSQYTDENIVKVKTKDEINENNISKAENFFRKLKNSDRENIYHHIGIYQYKVSVLEKIISLKQTDNEKKQKLEQLRALENNIDINVVLAKTSSIGVDKWSDYQKVKNLLETKN
jgi:3-deoxy-manno-octulosonate cytidylyltransferase (CMP-KDO synthetase)